MNITLASKARWTLNTKKFNMSILDRVLSGEETPNSAPNFQPPEFDPYGQTKVTFRSKKGHEISFNINDKVKVIHENPGRGDPNLASVTFLVSRKILDDLVGDICPPDTTKWHFLGPENELEFESRFWTGTAIHPFDEYEMTIHVNVLKGMNAKRRIDE